MEDCEHVLKNKMAFGVDTPPRPGDEGDETLLSKYSLHSEMSLVPPPGVWGELRGMGVTSQERLL